MTTRSGPKAKAYPLWNKGCFTWNKRMRQMVFMRAGDPDNHREELKKPTSFVVEGDDIKLLYQVLHEHFMTPLNKGGGNSTRRWSDLAANPDKLNAEARRKNGSG